MSVYFHGSFGLNRRYMSGVLNTLNTNPEASATEIAQPFGFRAPFTNKYKSWLQKTGLIDKKGPTQYGQVVFSLDPKLDSIITQWFMHHQLVKNPIDVETWYFFINEFLPQHDSFTRSQLEDGLEKKLMSHSTQHFSKGRPMNRVISKKLIECYLGDEALGALGILGRSNDGLFYRQEPKVKGPWNNPHEFKEQLKANSND